MLATHYSYTCAVHWPVLQCKELLLFLDTSHVLTIILLLLHYIATYKLSDSGHVAFLEQDHHEHYIELLYLKARS